MKPRVARACDRASRSTRWSSQTTMRMSATAVDVAAGHQRQPERHEGSPERRRADREVPTEPLGEPPDADQAEAVLGREVAEARAAVRDFEQGVPSALPDADVDLTPA